jgi:hypothetical protein
MAWRKHRPRLPLFLQSRRQHAQHVRHAAPGICTRLLAIAVFLAEIFGHALGKAALVVKPGVDQLQPARPGQPLLAANLVRQSEDILKRHFPSRVVTASAISVIPVNRNLSPSS